MLITIFDLKRVSAADILLTKNKEKIQSGGLTADCGT